MNKVSAKESMDAIAHYLKRTLPADAYEPRREVQEVCDAIAEHIFELEGRISKLESAIKTLFDDRI